MRNCVLCGMALDPGDTHCPGCGRANPPGSPDAPVGDSTGGIIPYKNPAALTAYYLGLFSVLPMFGFLLGAAAVPLGILGLRRRRQQPEVKGSVHAWIGIGCGGLGVLVWGAAIIATAYYAFQ